MKKFRKKIEKFIKKRRYKLTKDKIVLMRAVALYQDEHGGAGMPAGDDRLLSHYIKKVFVEENKKTSCNLLRLS